MLDTLKYAKRLQEAGFTAQQAEAQASALWEAIEDTVATKQDLRGLETRLNGRIDHLEARLDARFKEVDGRIDRLGEDLNGRVDRLDEHLNGRIDQQEIRTDGRFRLLYWMLGFNLALTAGILLKLLAG